MTKYRVFFSVTANCLGTPCELKAYAQGYAYPRLRTAGLAYTCQIRKTRQTRVTLAKLAWQEYLFIDILAKLDMCE